MDRFARYLTVPFVEGGRSLRGCDCFGLVALVLAGEAGVRLPELGAVFSDPVDRIAARVVEAIADSRAMRVELPQSFDLVQMTAQRGGRVHTGLHIGIMTSSRTVLHTERATGPRQQRIDRPSPLGAADRIVAFWRLPEFVR